MPRWDVGHLPGCRCYPEDTLKSALKLRATLCCKKIKKIKKKAQKKNTQKAEMFGQAARCGERATIGLLLSLQARSRMVWTGWLGWVPRSGLPSHIHTQNVCGAVNHFFQYRLMAGQL